MRRVACFSSSPRQADSVVFANSAGCNAFAWAPACNTFYTVFFASSAAIALLLSLISAPHLHRWGVAIAA